MRYFQHDLSNIQKCELYETLGYRLDDLYTEHMVDDDGALLPEIHPVISEKYEAIRAMLVELDPEQKNWTDFLEQAEKAKR